MTPSEVVIVILCVPVVGGLFGSLSQFVTRAASAIAELLVYCVDIKDGGISRDL